MLLLYILVLFYTIPIYLDCYYAVTIYILVLFYTISVYLDCYYAVTINKLYTCCYKPSFNGLLHSTFTTLLQGKKTVSTNRNQPIEINQ